jgi:hypothetical protein
MHYAFDKWMDREHPACHFERYADLSGVRDKSAYRTNHLSVGPAGRRFLRTNWARCIDWSSVEHSATIGAQPAYGVFPFRAVVNEIVMIAPSTARNSPSTFSVTAKY